MQSKQAFHFGNLMARKNRCKESEHPYFSRFDDSLYEMEKSLNLSVVFFQMLLRIRFCQNNLTSMNCNQRIFITDIIINV